MPEAKQVYTNHSLPQPKRHNGKHFDLKAEKRRVKHWIKTQQKKKAKANGSAR